jgi:hypothetical protein
MDPLMPGACFYSPKLGLQVGGTGFSLNGKSFKGIGINHFALALNDIVDMGVGGIGGSAADIQAIAKTWGLPFIRCSFGLYDRTSWYNNYYLNKTNYFAKLDAVVANCSTNGIGLIPVLFWDLRGFCDMTFDVYGTLSPLSALSDKTSKAWLMASTYITEVVLRYASSPYIYAWGLGNEIVNACGPEYFSTWVPDGTKGAFLSWGTRPGGGNYLATDKMTIAQWRDFSYNVVALIHSLDPYGRFISSGSPIGNSFAVNAQTTDTLAADSLTQWNSAAYGLSWVNYRAQAFDVIVNHIYPHLTSNGLFFSDGGKTQAQLIALTKGWADSAGKPMFLEEFGATYHGDPVDQTSVDLATETANFQAALTAIKANSVPLSCAWNYGGNFGGASAWQKWKMSDPAKTYQLTMLANANATL